MRQGFTVQGWQPFLRLFAICEEENCLYAGTDISFLPTCTDMQNNILLSLQHFGVPMKTLFMFMHITDYSNIINRREWINGLKL
jgi:hypothetical protein